MNKKRRDYTRGSIVKNMWILALPMMASNALQTLYNVIDMIFVGRLGAAPVAAVSIIGNIIMVLFALIMGLSIAAGAMVSRAFGAKDYDTANHVALQTIFYGGVLGIILTILGITFAPHIVDLFGVEPDVHLIATEFLRIIAMGAVAITQMFLVASIFQAVGDAQTAMWLMVGAVLMNVVLDPLMIFGMGPFPRMEVAGAAWATTISRTTCMIIAVMLLFIKKTHLHLKPERFSVDWGLLKRMVKIGAPSSLQMGLRSASGIIMMAIVAGYGTYAVAAYGIGIRIDMLIMMPGFGLGAATATLVGQNLGAGKPLRAVQSTWTAMFFFVGIMILAGTTFYIFAHQLFNLFTHNSSVIHSGIEYIHIMVWSYPFIAMAVIFNRGLSGAGETFWPMLVTGIALYGVAVPLSLIIPKVWDTGVTGVWYSLVLSNFVNAVIIAVLFIRGKWMHKQI